MWLQLPKILPIKNTCERVAKVVREMLGKTSEFEVGEKLVCRKYMKVGDKSLNVNFEYVISKKKNCLSKTKNKK